VGLHYEGVAGANCGAFIFQPDAIALRIVLGFGGFLPPVSCLMWMIGKTGSLRARYVASVSRGAAVTHCRSLKLLGKICNIRDMKTATFEVAEIKSSLLFSSWWGR
jgi:hypothetical protein